jgi:AcrR family transcriptional regulator
MSKESKPKKRPKSVKTRKGHQSSTNIVNAALDLIRERGYEETTMRAIAEKAGVSLGNAYHYYPSKAHLIQAFYHRLHDEQVAASRPILEAESSLKARLLEVMRMKIAKLEPYHQFAGALFKTAADPKSPLNPFGDEADAVRSDSIGLFDEIVTTSKARVPKDLAAELPYLLWLYNMGIVLFWIHDSSPKQSRTYRLIVQTVELLDKLISLASNPLMSPVRKKALRLVAELRDDIRRDTLTEAEMVTT